MTPQPLTIGASNAVAVVGMSWAWVRRFAAAHGVPIYRVGPRKVLVDGAALLRTIEGSAAQPAPELDARQELARRLGGV